MTNTEMKELIKTLKQAGQKDENEKQLDEQSLFEILKESKTKQSFLNVFMKSYGCFHLFEATRKILQNDKQTQVERQIIEGYKQNTKDWENR